MSDKCVWEARVVDGLSEWLAGWKKDSQVNLRERLIGGDESVITRQVITSSVG